AFESFLDVPGIPEAVERSHVGAFSVGLGQALVHVATFRFGLLLNLWRGLALLLRGIVPAIAGLRHLIIGVEARKLLRERLTQRQSLGALGNHHIAHARPHVSQALVALALCVAVK